VVVVRLSPPPVQTCLLAGVLHVVMGQAEDLLADLRAGEFNARG
jgi:hypothetical protein